MSDRSDYDKPRINVHDLLPEVNRSDTARVFFENTTNRFLSKKDMVKSVGIIGNQNPTDRIDRRIAENDSHRKAFQLQPLIRAKVATVDHVMSFVDAMNELERLGVDISRMAKWGESLGFNFIPPVTLDKIVNYRDYFWYDETDPTSKPQYITIENYLATAEARLSEKRQDIQSFGQQHPISGISLSQNAFISSADLTFLNPGNKFKTKLSTLYNIRTWTVKSVSEFIGGVTIVEVLEELDNGDSVVDGVIDFEIQLCDLSPAWSMVEVASQVKNDWMLDNKWVHKKDLPEGVVSLTTRAEIPIIEYHPGLQLNEWSYTKHSWYHRTNITDPFVQVDYEPADSDIVDPDFLNKWVYIGDESAVPIDYQSETSPGDEIVLSTFDTSDNLTYTFDVSGQSIALVSEDQIRVYVDGIRSYGTYYEEDDGNGYINAITFTSVQSARIDVHVTPAAAEDINTSLSINRNAVEVRTTLDDTEYQFDVIATTQPVTKSIVRYRKVEQVKEKGEVKYPLFDMFLVNGESAKDASPLFRFLEDSTYNIIPAIGKRIRVTNDGRNFFFEQTLIEDNTNKIFAFKDLQSITTSNPEGLQTIWRKGLNNETYTPKWVDSNNNEVPLTEDGYWEIPNQLFYNVSHENRKELSLAELTTHFNTINQNQETPSIFFKQDNFAHRLLYDLNLGVGGTIKEYNDNYDLLMSTIFDNNTNVIDVIEFARQQYLSLQNTIREYLTDSMLSFLLNDTSEFLNDLYGSIATEIITRYENSDINNLVYGDSHTFDSETNSGIKNWIITIPFIEMAIKQYPHVLFDPVRGIKELNHHDGHYNSFLLNPRNVNNFKKNIIKQELFPGRLRGWTDSIPADGGTPVTRTTVSWTRLLKNDYWLEGNDLYNFRVVSISSTQPSLSFSDGSLWLNGGVLFVRDSSHPDEWVYDPSLNVDDAWVKVDFDELALSVFNEIELKLFETAPNNTAIKYESSDYILDVDDQELYDQLQEEYFLEYTRSLNILDPYGTDFSLTNPFTWNYKDVVYDGGITVHRPNATSIPLWGNRWHSIYEEIYNTPYPHLQPWKLQGYDNKPLWWDTEYKDLTGSRRWKAAMWTDIMTGVNTVDGVAPNSATYSFVSVNINDAAETGGYKLDDLYPPFDGNLIGTPLAEDQLFIRNISAINFGTISDGYAFGEVGPNEWMYKKSIGYLYNQLKIIFRMQPIKLMQKLWGNQTIEVAGLIVDQTQQKVLSHSDMIFHGDLIDGEVYKLNGLGQWYINFNRLNNLDSKKSDFREMWTTWKAQLGYQFNGFIDPRSFESFTQNFNLTENDRTIIVKKSPAARNYWADSLTVTVSKFGSRILKNGVKVPKTKGYDWEFVIDTTVPTSRDISFYSTKNYQVEVVNPADGLFEVISDDTLAWNTGDVVYFDSSNKLPVPLTPDPGTIHQAEVDDLQVGIPYYIIIVSGNTFKVASSFDNAQSNLPIEFYDSGIGDIYVYEPSSSFFVYEQRNTTSTWFHNAMDDTQVKTVKFPITIKGIQNVIDVIDGYSSYLYDRGFRFNDTERLELDPNTGLFINWQTEIERLVDGIYTGLGISNTPNMYKGKTYNFASTFTTDVINSSLNSSVVETGQKVFLFTSGVLPAPLQQNTEYYLIVLNNSNQYKLATTLENAFLEQSIDLTNDGVGQHSLGVFEDNTYQSQRFIEVNPFRNNLWYSPDRGVVSNSLIGPYEDIKVEKTIYDQYGRPFERKDLMFFREDKITRFKVINDIPNDVVPNVNNITGEVDEYNYIHISGINLFVDDYEHVVIFEDYSVGDYLIYDSFIGLRTPRFYVEFEKQRQQVSRPSVGGFVLDGNDMVRNIEASISDMQRYYDTNEVSEAAPFIKYARDLLGYTNPIFLDRVSATEKTKFLFWKGMIQQKGSLNAVKAFINSARFEDARVDEFWAYRIGEYGDRKGKNYPSLKVNVADVKRGDLRLHFTNSVDSVLETTFTEITFADQQRWLNLPDVIINSNNNENLVFESELTSVQDYNISGTLTSDQYIELDMIADGVHIVSQTLLNVRSDIKYLIEGVHYDQINSKIIRLNATAINNWMSDPAGDVSIPAFTNEDLKIYTINPSYRTLNPSKLIDNISKTVITEISIWDPIRDYHSYDVINDVDLLHYGDPVRFPSSALDVSEFNWTNNKRHTIWLDTSKLGYRSYYDSRLITNANEQVGIWSNFADWSTADVYVWTKSSVAPEFYSDLVAQEENDITISETERASGTPYKPLWKYDKNIFSVVQFNNYIFNVVEFDNYNFNVTEFENVSFNVLEFENYNFDVIEFENYNFDVIEFENYNFDVIEFENYNFDVIEFENYNFDVVQFDNIQNRIRINIGSSTLVPQSGEFITVNNSIPNNGTYEIISVVDQGSGDYDLFVNNLPSSVLSPGSFITFNNVNDRIRINLGSSSFIPQPNDAITITNTPNNNGVYNIISTFDVGSGVYDLLIDNNLNSEDLGTSNPKAAFLQLEHRVRINAGSAIDIPQPGDFISINNSPNNNGSYDVISVNNIGSGVYDIFINNGLTSSTVGAAIISSSNINDRVRINIGSSNIKPQAGDFITINNSNNNGSYEIVAVTNLGSGVYDIFIDKDLSSETVGSSNVLFTNASSRIRINIGTSNLIPQQSNIITVNNSPFNNGNYTIESVTNIGSGIYDLFVDSRLESNITTSSYISFNQFDDRIRINTTPTNVIPQQNEVLLITDSPYNDGSYTINSVVNLGGGVYDIFVNESLISQNVGSAALHLDQINDRVQFNKGTSTIIPQDGDIITIQNSPNNNGIYTITMVDNLGGGLYNLFVDVPLKSETIGSATIAFDRPADRIKIDTNTSNVNIELGEIIVINQSLDNDGSYTITSIDDLGGGVYDLLVEQRLKSNILGSATASFNRSYNNIRIDVGTLETNFNQNDYIIIRNSVDNDGKYTIVSVIDQGGGLYDLFIDEDLTSNTLGTAEALYDWRRVEPGELFEEFYEANRGTAGITHKFEDGSTVDVYINGEYSTTGIVNVSDSPTYSSIITPNITDKVTIIRNVTDDIENGLFKNDFDFITKQVSNVSGTGSETVYYFWVKDRALSSKNHTFSAKEISTRLTKINKPHQFFRNLVKVENGNRPSYYTQHIVRDIDSFINDNNRYSLRYTKDYSLRDGKSSILTQKNVHEEWKLFREKQPEIIPRALWTKLVNSVVGLDVDELDRGNTIAVPSLERVLYDQINNSTTRFGIRIGQTLIDKTRGLEIIFETILLDDFVAYPIDKYTFVESADLSSPESIRLVIEFIYNNFPTDSVNRIFFSVLREALAAKIEYSDIIKTSMLALHGIRVLQTVGGDSL